MRELKDGAVLFVDEPIVRLNKSELEKLKQRIPITETGRVRLCAHPNEEDALHEMFIVLSRGVYIRPHMHPGKSESFHLIEGRIDVVIFSRTGEIAHLIKMSDYHSGETFFYRLPQGTYHTVLVRSEIALVHETVNGPFDNSSSIYAPWAPDEGEAAQQYLEEIESRLERLQQPAATG